MPIGMNRIDGGIGVGRPGKRRGSKKVKEKKHQRIARGRERDHMYSCGLQDSGAAAEVAMAVATVDRLA